VIQLLGGGHESIRVLDYGGGSGVFARTLREGGFAHVDVYDPLVPEFARPPGGTYDLILCFEVIEHSTQPRQTLGHVASLLNDPGMVLLSTSLQPPNFEELGVNWWYVAPRNGHVSIFSENALELAGRFAGLPIRDLRRRLARDAQDGPAIRAAFRAGGVRTPYGEVKPGNFMHNLRVGCIIPFKRRIL
jgi:hypothetical protein